jgi:2-hydroxy-3-oxopropionate reductase
MIGTGAMGTPMAHHLIRARGRLAIWSRAPRPDLVDVGAPWHTSRARRATPFSSCCPTSPTSRTPRRRRRPARRRRDLLLLIGSTSSPTGVRAIAERLHRQSGGRVRVVDCPVSGGVDGASAGTLSIMLGGTDADAALAAQILSPCGTPVHLGPLGAGEVAKACNQLVVAATIVALGGDRTRRALGARSRRPVVAAGGRLRGVEPAASRKDRLVAGDDSPRAPPPTW